MQQLVQFAMSLTYMAVALLLYPHIKRQDPGLAIGYLSFRIIAVSLSIIGTALLLSVLALSQTYALHATQQTPAVAALGHVLRATRDYINHVFMILVLCCGNCICYLLFLKSSLVPNWLAVWGITGALLSIAASILFLSGAVNILSMSYLALNAPAAVQELILGLWLLIRGFNKNRKPDQASSWVDE